MSKRSNWDPLNFGALRTHSIHGTTKTVGVADFATLPHPGSSVREFLRTFPDILAGKVFREVVDAVVAAALDGKTVIVGMGAHLIKVGLSPVIIHLMEQGVISAVAMNGAGVIHDLEIAMAGKTSEAVEEHLGEGHFGATRETAEFINTALVDGKPHGWGMGACMGWAMAGAGFPHQRVSICAAAHRLNVPLTVHVAIGTDVVHIHPSTDGAVLGEATYRDFRLFASIVSSLEDGVYINLGSAVIMPEVFLKALSAARNLGYTVNHFVTVNMDFIQHYRPVQNVVRRPTARAGKGYTLTGHHELMVPLLAAAILEGLASRP